MGNDKACKLRAIIIGSIYDTRFREIAKSFLDDVRCASIIYGGGEYNFDVFFDLIGGDFEHGVHEAPTKKGTDDILCDKIINYLSRAPENRLFGLDWNIEGEGRFPTGRPTVKKACRDFYLSIFCSPTALIVAEKLDLEARVAFVSVEICDGDAWLCVE